MCRQFFCNFLQKLFYCIWYNIFQVFAILNFQYLKKYKTDTSGRQKTLRTETKSQQKSY